MSVGLDGKFLNGEEELHVIGDVESREFMGITHGSSAIELENLLWQKLILEEQKIIKVWSIDMSKKLKGVCMRVSPDTPIVVDKFHVIKFANRGIDLCRIAVEKSVNERWQIKRVLLMKTDVFQKIQHKDKWKYKAKLLKHLLKTRPEIKLLWDLKNKINGFYRCKSIESAVKNWHILLQFLEDNASVHPEFRDLKKTFLNWETEILNYFIFRVTNAYIEGLNNRIETLKRKKFGFRNKERFLNSISFSLFPIALFFPSLIFTH